MLFGSQYGRALLHPASFHWVIVWREEKRKPDFSRLIWLRVLRVKQHESKTSGSLDQCFSSTSPGFFSRNTGAGGATSIPVKPCCLDSMVLNKIMADKTVSMPRVRSSALTHTRRPGYVCVKNHHQTIKGGGGKSCISRTHSESLDGKFRQTRKSSNSCNIWRGCKTSYLFYEWLSSRFV